MAGARLVVVLALASLLAAQAAQTRPSFVEWISQGPGKVQSAYEEVETESTCLQTISLGHCRCKAGGLGVWTSPEGTKYDTCLSTYAEIKLGCCESEGSEKYSSTVEELIATKHSVGSCVIEQNYFPNPIAYRGDGSSGCLKIGRFTGQCELAEKSSQCGSPLCEGMTLLLEGDILRYNKVAFIGSPFEIPADGECSVAPPGIFLPPGFGLPQSPRAPAQDNKTPAKIQNKEESKGETTYSLGPGDIYAGVFTVISKDHKTSFKAGSFEQVISSDPTEANYQHVTHDTLPGKAYVAKDGAAALDFYKNGGDY